MIKFLINRPIAVMMSFLAAIILGVITYFTLPVSLLPDIAIPEITVQISSENTSARQLENTVVKPIRSQLLQVAHLTSIESRTRDGGSIIRMRFSYGTDTDYTFIEVNEKIDAAMNYLPQNTQRPRVIKASATDLPVFNLNLTLKKDIPYQETDRDKFLELSDFASSVIKRRVEQLPEVAMVDVTGTESRELTVIPDQSKMATAGITLSEIENLLKNSNSEPGSMSVRDGYYEYNVKMSSVVRTKEDVENIYLNKNNRLMRLKDIARVEIAPEKPDGYSFYNGRRSIVFSVIKQSDTSMDDMKKSVSEAIETFRKQYPDIDFSISQNQTELLDYTLENLQSNLWIGFVLICIISIFFFKDARTPAVISLGMVVSLVISMLFYYLFSLSLNIISLSGLILALGMMIDSSIIVTDNISQYREKDGLLDQACIRGTNEIIRPLLSSILTTIAVFVPLVFISGIAGAIFYDQAMSVSLGLGVSYIVGIIFLPVAYRIFYGSKKLSSMKMPRWAKCIFDKVDSVGWMKFYDRGFDFVFNHRKWIIPCLVLIIPLTALLFDVIEKRKMPFLDHNETVITIEWNENIHLDENRRRVIDLLQNLGDDVLESSALVGEQQFILNRNDQLSSSESQVYLRSHDTKSITAIEEQAKKHIASLYPHAKVTMAPPENIFEKIFSTSEAEYTANIMKKEGDMSDSIDSLLSFTGALAEKTGGKAEISLSSQLNISVNNSALLLYGVSYNSVYQALRTLFGANKVSTLRSNQQYLPIVVAWESSSGVDELLSRSMVTSSEGKQVPLSAFIKVLPGIDFKTIYSGRNGEFIPVNYTGVKNPDKLTDEIRREVLDSKIYEVDITGSIFSNRALFMEMGIVLGISVLLLYFILAAQFESLMQPLIVLIELPIDIAAALLVLWLCGNSLNIMSAIGIVVACGIIINDSILKIDVINQLRKEGMPILEAIHTAGHRRLRAIVMTSLTTILAMVPLLFSRDMGSELQAPLSLALIGGMTVGTLVSLFIIPLIYWFIYRKHECAEIGKRPETMKNEIQ